MRFIKGTLMVSALWLGGALVGLPLYMLAQRLGWTTDTAAFMAGSVGQLAGMISFGIIVESVK